MPASAKSATVEAPQRTDGWRAGWTIALFGLCVFTFAIVTYRWPVGEVGIALAALGILIQRAPLRAPPAFWFVAAFLAWGSVSSLISPFPVSPAHSLVERLKLLVIFLLACNAVRTPRQVLVFLAFFLACFVLFPVRGALVNYFVAGYTVFGRALWNYIYSNPNDLAAFSLLALGVSLAIATGRGASRWVRVGASGAALLLLFLILLTQSRGAFIGLVGGFGFAAIRLALSKGRALLVAGALAGFAAFFVPAAVWDRLSGITKLTSTETIAEADWEGSAAQRFEIQKVALKVFGDNWLLGVGPGSYPAANALYAPDLGYRDTHNTYLNIAAEVGLPGLLLWLCAIGSVLISVARSRSVDRARANAAASLDIVDTSWMSRGVVAFLLASFFGTYSVMSQFYVLLAILSCAHANAAPRVSGVPSVPDRRV